MKKDNKNYLLSLSELKKVMFSFELKKFPYLNNFSSNPYTYIKARYYMYSSVLLVFALLRTRITPNSVTIVYALLGIVVGVLLSIPNFYCNLLAVFIAFNKGILDWSDGHLARIKYKASLTGHLLDEYGAALNIIGFYIGLGFFVVHQTGYHFLIYTIPLIVFFNGEQFRTSASVSIINSLSEIIKTEKNNTSIANEVSDTNSKENLKRFLEWITKFGLILDGRARSTDLMLLIVLIDIYYESYLSLYVYGVIFFGLMAKFILSLVLGVRRKWAEQVIQTIK